MGQRSGSPLGLSPGVLVEMGAQSRLRDLRTGLTEPLTAAPLEILEAIALGEGDLGELPELWRARAARGLWIEPGGSVHDAVLEEAIGATDARFAWFLERLSDDERAAHALLTRAHASRRLHRHDLGQCPALPETGIRRALLMRSAGVRRAALVGDDDLVSIALGAMGVEVVVFDIDAYLLRLIEALAAEHRLPITCVRTDVRDPRVDEHAASFDGFFADPMSNEDCLSAFVELGERLLLPFGRGWVCASPAAEVIVRRSGEAYGFDVDDHYIAFNHYYWSDARLSDYVSDLYALKHRGERTGHRQGAVLPGRFYDEVVHRALAVGRLHFADLDPSRLHNRDLQRFVGLLVGELGRTVLAEQWSFVDEGAAYTAHLSGPVAFHLVFRRDGAHLEMVFVPTDPALLARTRLSALKYFKVEARMMHVMRGHGIVSQIVEHGGERSS